MPAPPARARFVGVAFVGVAVSVASAASPAAAQDAPALPAPADPPAGTSGNGYERGGLAAPALPAPAPDSQQNRTQAPPTRVREGGVDARRFEPVPGDARDRDDARNARPADADDRRVAPRSAPDGYQYAPDSGRIQPPGGLLGGDSRLAPQLRNPGGQFPGEYYDPDRSPVLLGVQGSDTTEGVVITRVVPGTPADAAGLERGDKVLTVGGYQVGVVATPAGPRVYPLGRELARRIGPTGEVTLLVQDHRSGRVTNVVARPQPRLGPTDPYGGGQYGDAPYNGGPYDDGRYNDGLRNGPGGGYGPDTGFGTGVDPLGRGGRGLGLDLGVPGRGVRFRRGPFRR